MVAELCLVRAGIPPAAGHRPHPEWQSWQDLEHVFHLWQLHSSLLGGLKIKYLSSHAHAVESGAIGLGTCVLFCLSSHCVIDSI